MTPEERRVLARVRAELERLYGDRLRRVILYGSRARGDARPDSDHDVLAVLEPPGRRWDELTLPMENVRREGVAV